MSTFPNFWYLPSLYACGYSSTFFSFANDSTSFNLYEIAPMYSRPSGRRFLIYLKLFHRQMRIRVLNTHYTNPTINPFALHKSPRAWLKGNVALRLSFFSESLDPISFHKWVLKNLCLIGVRAITGLFLECKLIVPYKSICSNARLRVRRTLHLERKAYVGSPFDVRNLQLLPKKFLGASV